MSGGHGVVVVGGSGFIGSAVMLGLERHGVLATSVVAPRLLADGRAVDALLAEAVERSATVESLARRLSGASCVINAAGVADAGAGDAASLLGANALLPRIVQLACRAAGVPRYVHVSSAAVQGRAEVLDETPALLPFSAYSQSKAVAEQLLGHDLPGLRTVLFRPTSVHGVARRVTRSLVRLARSPLASVAGAGDRPTPQVLVQNVGAAIASAALWPTDPPGVVLQPGEGLTTSALLRVLGGREPRHVPERLAQAVITASMHVGARRTQIAAQARRLEMVWFGQQQQVGWLEQQGWTPPFGRDAWTALSDRELSVAHHREGSFQ